MTNTQKIWSEEAYMQYPKQWIVFVEMEYDPETDKYMGLVHLVTDSKDEAFEMARGLNKSRGKSAVIEGFNDTPHDSKDLYNFGYK